MKAGRFAVSVQWGAGRHYFTWTGDDPHNANMAKLLELQKLARRRKKLSPAVAPEVHVWTKLDSLD